MPVFKNEQKFKKWYKENYKGDFETLNWDVILDDDIDRILQCQTGPEYTYELGKFETKSGHAEIYSFNVEYKYDDIRYEMLEDALDDGEYEVIVTF